MLCFPLLHRFCPPIFFDCCFFFSISESSFVSAAFRSCAEIFPPLMADIFHVPLTYLQPDQSLFIERAAEAYGKKGKIEAQHLAFELTELFASGELTPQDMDGIMYEMHKAYFKYREQKREKERIMNL